MIKPKESAPTKADITRVIEITAAEDFIKKYYPGLWGRMDENDMLQVITLTHMLYKTNPEYLEVTPNSRRTPTQ